MLVPTISKKAAALKVDDVLIRTEGDELKLGTIKMILPSGHGYLDILYYPHEKEINVTMSDRYKKSDLVLVLS